MPQVTRRTVLTAGVAAAGMAVDPLSSSAAAVPAAELKSTSLGLNVNGKANTLSIDIRTTLLDALREHLHLTGTKKGCDQGQCGCTPAPTFTPRRLNDTQVDPVDGKPYSSRSLIQCFDQAAAKFDWKRRKQQPGGTRQGDWLVGFGCATSCYPSNVGPAAARVALTSDGKATVDIAGHEIGTGAYTVVAIIAARALGIAPEDLHTPWALILLKSTFTTKPARFA